MAVTVTNDDKSNKLTLELDNGDYEKFKKTLEKWSFKDSQSLLRFAISILLETKEKIGILDETGELTKVSPSDHLLRCSDESEVW